jgi:hypothetical protein
MIYFFLGCSIGFSVGVFILWEALDNKDALIKKISIENTSLKETLANITSKSKC